MKSYHLSNTYISLYKYIVGDLLSQICKNNINCCVQNKEIPYIIGEKFEYYKNKAQENMSGNRLDRHKLASCICGAIIDVKPIIGLNRATIAKNTNEIFALYVGLGVIKFYMTYTLVEPLNIPSKTKENIVKYLVNNLSIQFPAPSENICDVQNYKTNLINSLYWTHQQCNITSKECFCYDIWAYSKIFYHIELHNKKYFEESFQEYIKNRKI